jgi:hypothetical protein
METPQFLGEPFLNGAKTPASTRRFSGKSQVTIVIGKMRQEVKE